MEEKYFSAKELKVANSNQKTGKKKLVEAESSNIFKKTVKS